MPRDAGGPLRGARHRIPERCEGLERSVLRCVSFVPGQSQPRIPRDARDSHAPRHGAVLCPDPRGAPLFLGALLLFSGRSSFFRDAPRALPCTAEALPCMPTGKSAPLVTAPAFAGSPGFCGRCSRRCQGSAQLCPLPAAPPKPFDLGPTGNRCRRRGSQGGGHRGGQTDSSCHRRTRNPRAAHGTGHYQVPVDR